MAEIAASSPATPRIERWANVVLLSLVPTVVPFVLYVLCRIVGLQGGSVENGSAGSVLLRVVAWIGGSMAVIDLLVFVRCLWGAVSDRRCGGNWGGLGLLALLAGAASAFCACVMAMYSYGNSM